MTDITDRLRRFGTQLDKTAALEIERLRDRIVRLEDGLKLVEAWSRAYPETAFPVPDLLKARELLEAGGVTLDSVSAHAMRHVVMSVGQIAHDALIDDEGRQP